MAKLYSACLTSSIEVHGISRVGKQNRVCCPVFSTLLEITNLANLVTCSKVYVNILERLSKGSGKQVQICVYFPDFRNQSYHDTAKCACLLLQDVINPTATSDAWAKPSLPSLRQPYCSVLLSASCLCAAFCYVSPRCCSGISQHCKVVAFGLDMNGLFSHLHFATLPSTRSFLWFPPPTLPCPVSQGERVKSFQRICLVFLFMKK